MNLTFQGVPVEFSTVQIGRGRFECMVFALTDRGERIDELVCVRGDNDTECGAIAWRTLASMDKREMVKRLINMGGRVGAHVARLKSELIAESLERDEIVCLEFKGQP